MINVHLAVLKAFFMSIQTIASQTWPVLFMTCYTASMVDFPVRNPYWLSARLICSSNLFLIRCFRSFPNTSRKNIGRYFSLSPLGIRATLAVFHDFENTYSLNILLYTLIVSSGMASTIILTLSVLMPSGSGASPIFNLFIAFA